MSQFVDDYEREEEECQECPLEDSEAIDVLPFKRKPFLWFHWCKLPLKPNNYTYGYDIGDRYVLEATQDCHVLYGGCINKAEEREFEEMDEFFQDVTAWVINESPGGRRITRRERQKKYRIEYEESKYDEFERMRFYIKRQLEKQKNIQRKIEYDNKKVRLESSESLPTVEPEQNME